MVVGSLLDPSVGSFCKLVACHVGIFEAGNCDLTSHFTISFPQN